MKTIKKAFFLTICILIGTISQVLAQPMNRAGMNAPGIQNLITEYGDDLNLTHDQKTELIALQIEYKNEFREVARENFRRDRDGRRGSRGRGIRNTDRELVKTRAESRMDMGQEVLGVLTDEQAELLQAKMIDKAEKAHEFRTFRHRYIIEQAGIEGDKADQVESLLNAQSENRLEIDKQRILKPEELNRDAAVNRFQQVRDANDELRSILTVDEYESLRKNLGFADRSDRNRGPKTRRWSR